MPKKDAWLLHISDLHIANPKSNKDLLRKSYYQEMIQNFATKILSVLSTQELAGVIVTGDLVNMGSIEHLAHVKAVLMLLCKELMLMPNRLFGVHGNHDFKTDVALAKGYTKAIEPITRLFDEFGNSDKKRINPLGSLLPIKDGIQLLLLDSLLNGLRDGFGAPGKPTAKQIDQIITTVRTKVNEDDVLIVGSHYPLTDFGINTGEDMQHRLWREGRDLATRLGTLRKDCNGATVWLSGDIHIPFEPRGLSDSPNIVSLLGCHFDQNTARKSQQAVGAVLFRVTPGTREGVSTMLQGIQRSHVRKSIIDKWQMTEEMAFGENTIASPTSLLRIPNVATVATTDSTAVVRDDHGGITERIVPVVLFPEPGTSQLDGDARLEQQIIDTVTQQGLYHFGRFETSADQVSLGWVSMGPLLAGRYTGSSRENPIVPLLSQVVPRIRNWIDDTRRQLRIGDTPTEVLLYGVDCWGAVIASQVSIATGWKNFCLAGRGDGMHHTKYEGITDGIIRDTRQASLGVFLVDVISSGYTLRRLHTRLTNRLVSAGGVLDEKHANRKWIAASILCDELLMRSPSLNFLESIGCACKRLRIPNIAADRLPDQIILPQKVCFTSLTIQENSG